MLVQWIIKIVLFAVYGAVAGYIMKGKKGSLLKNILMGFIGSIVGGILASLLPIPGAGNWIVGSAISIAGACLCIWLARKLF